ncbi:MAG TPA: DUF4282 domain-containing protein [Candidatus Stackebrandtia excrementipullorum]|nr:DUF4282 domain-containing protein [Candidatus Stackebrandtia excrementipullorum]
MSARPDPVPDRLGVLTALGDAGVTGYAGRRLIGACYAVNLVVSALIALAAVLMGTLTVVEGDPLGWLAIVLGPALCLLFLMSARLRLEAAAARFDVRDDVAAIRRSLAAGSVPGQEQP